MVNSNTLWINRSLGCMKFYLVKNKNAIFYIFGCNIFFTTFLGKNSVEEVRAIRNLTFYSIILNQGRYECRLNNLCSALEIKSK